MRKLQTNKVEAIELVIDNGKSVTTCDVEAAQVLCNHFQESFTVEKQVDGHMNNGNLNVHFHLLLILTSQ